MVKIDNFKNKTIHVSNIILIFLFVLPLPRISVQGGHQQTTGIEIDSKQKRYRTTEFINSRESS